MDIQCTFPDCKCVTCSAKSATGSLVRMCKTIFNVSVWEDANKLDPSIAKEKDNKK